MKRGYIICLFAIVCIAVRGADASKSPPIPRFIGYLAIGPEKWFALSLGDAKDGGHSWVKIGQKLGEFEVASFDGKTESLTLRSSSGKDTIVKLSDRMGAHGGVAPGELQ